MPDAKKNANRQRAWKERQREQGRAPWVAWVTDGERHALERVLLQMRKTGQMPAQMRGRDGKFAALDI